MKDLRGGASKQHHTAEHNSRAARGDVRRPRAGVPTRFHRRLIIVADCAFPNDSPFPRAAKAETEFFNRCSLFTHLFYVHKVTARTCTLHAV